MDLQQERTVWACKWTAARRSARAGRTDPWPDLPARALLLAGPHLHEVPDRGQRSLRCGAPAHRRARRRRRQEAAALGAARRHCARRGHLRGWCASKERQDLLTWTPCCRQKSSAAHRESLPVRAIHQRRCCAGTSNLQTQQATALCLVLTSPETWLQSHQAYPAPCRTGLPGLR